LLDDLLTMLGEAPVSVVDGSDLTIEIRSATRSTELCREAVNAYLGDEDGTCKQSLQAHRPIIS